MASVRGGRPTRAGRRDASVRRRGRRSSRAPRGSRDLEVGEPGRHQPTRLPAGRTG